MKKYFATLILLLIIASCSNVESNNAVKGNLEFSKEFNKTSLKSPEIVREDEDFKIDWSAEMTYEERIQAIKSIGLGEGNITHKNGKIYLESGKYVVGEDLEPGRWGFWDYAFYIICCVSPYNSCVFSCKA